ncbi:MAG: hypothetical protein IKT41_00670 [Clostridia bacterium]|nr:hypothetical protein [Clostridia bacterium]
MKIEYYCFPTKTGDISVFMDLDQYTNWREKEYYERTQEDVLLSKEKGKLLLFDLRNNSFINEKGENIEISGKIIFPRSTIGDADLLMEHIEKAGGKSITARKDYKIVENWYELIKTKREFKVTTRGEIEKNLEKYEKQYGKTFFIKTIEKGFSGIVIIFEFALSDEGIKTKCLMDSTMHSINMSISNPETKVLVYKALDIVKDGYGKREWRAFVVNNELLCLSRFSDHVVPIEDYVYEKVKIKIEEFKGIMPLSYVVDFFEYTEENGEIIFDICEFNPIIASGVFQNNDLVF